MPLLPDKYWGIAEFVNGALHVSILIQEGKTRAATWRLVLMAEAAHNAGRETLSHSATRAAMTLKKKGICGALGAELIVLADDLTSLKP